ncbi:EamA family transporter [Shewanella sp. GXUN23E]|uniref:EamA family transporter n=1 Tax=Shewanella sp. GXUN23E TaxID=3422498 RepID=UPI003D7CE3EE
MWILFTLLAAFAQSWRNALQSQLSRDVNAIGVTLARFLWAGPLAGCYLLALYHWQPAAMPTFVPQFWQFVIGAALMQILATTLMVKLFQLQNFAIGAGLAKSEALVAAVLGTLFFGTSLSLMGWGGVLLGTVAIFMLSSVKGWRQLSLATVMLGIACGSSFALTSLWVREASLVLNVPFPHKAAWVLLCVILLQTVMLLTYLLWRDRHTLTQLRRHAGLTWLISISSCIGSIGWFSAMALEPVPYVKTLGQVEVFFTLLISGLWLKDKITGKEVAGLLLIALAGVMVMWGK